MGTEHMLARDDRRVLFDLGKGPWAAVFSKHPFAIGPVHSTLMKKAWSSFFNEPYDNSLFKRIKSWAGGQLVHRVNDSSDEDLQEMIDRGYIVTRTRYGSFPDEEKKLDAAADRIAAIMKEVKDFVNGTVLDAGY